MVKYIETSFEILSEFDGKKVLQLIEKAGRTCYKSEGKINEGSFVNFAKMIVERQHLSVIEHFSVTVKITCDRGVTHEQVRHRLASYSQESTRFVNYSKGVNGSEIAVSPMLDGLNEVQLQRRQELYEHCEHVYMAEIAEGIKPQQARDNLPTCTKTEIVVTANLREWGHIFKLRTSEAAHPQMRKIMLPILAEFRKQIPVIFDDLSIF